MARTILNVPDIECEHCERTVLDTLQPRTGIRAVVVDIPGKKVTLEYDEAKIDLGAIGTLLEEEGYPVESAVPA